MRREYEYRISFYCDDKNIIIYKIFINIKNNNHIHIMRLLQRELIYLSTAELESICAI